MRLFHFCTFVFSVALAVYWLISAALLANLYTRYCDDLPGDCDDTDEKFILLPVMGFLAMAAWVSSPMFNTVTHPWVKIK